jgi:hypothetical protein
MDSDSEESLVEYCLRRSRGWMVVGSLEMLRNCIAEEIFECRCRQRAPRAARA